MTIPVKKTKKNYNLPGPGPGRPKGSKNKFTDLKNAFLEAFEELNGTEGLVKWAKMNNRNRAQFYQMITKMLPSNVSLDHTGNVDTKMTINVVHIKEDKQNEHNAK